MTMRRAVGQAPGPRRTCSPAATRALALVVVIGAAVTSVSCAPTAPPAPGASPSPSVSASATSEPAAPEAPALVPEGTADDNLPYFSAIVDEVWGSDRRGEGRAYVDALVEAGFDRAAMQVTEDLTTVGNPAESMQFSVRWDDQCLIGQVGPDIGETVARVLPALEDGTVCLLGDTRPIDW